MAPDMGASLILHMNGGKDKNSYYRNSQYQKEVISKVKPMLQESIEELCRTNLPKCLKIVEMGCSSGPNALLPLWEVIETVDATCNDLNMKPPILQVFLNDLPGNDFNTIFKYMLPSFHEKLNKEKGCNFGPCFVGAIPGSFYGRLFPPNFLHFVHSSFSLHWCSQVPEELTNEIEIPLNKGNICIAKTSPPSVHQAYLNQFQKDFTTFLMSRSKEMVSGGFMTLVFLGKRDTNPYCRYGSEVCELIGNSMMDMVNEGLIEESMLDLFNVPLYTPSAKEVANLIQREGSFTVRNIEELEIRWDANIDDGNKELVFDKWERGKYVATYMRAVAESMVESHFGGAFDIDDLFHRLSLKVADYLEKGIGSFINLAISISRK